MLGFIEGENKAVTAAQGAEGVFQAHAGPILELLRHGGQGLVHFRDFELFEFGFDGFPGQRNIHVGVGRERRVFGEEIQFLEGMGRVAEGGPDHAVALALIMVDDELVVVEAGARAMEHGADAADLLDAAVLDQAVHDFKDAGESLVANVRREGGLAEHIADGGDALGQAAQGLLGAEVKIEVAALVEFGGDPVEAVFLGGDDGLRWGAARRGAAGRAGTIFPFAAGNEGDGGEEDGDGGGLENACVHGFAFD